VQADLLALEEIAALPASTNSSGADAFPGVHVKAAALMAELLHRRPFDRANRRIALLSAIVFLAINDYEVRASDEELAELTTLASEGKLSILLLAAAFESATVRISVANTEADI
jgi:death-on-curing protein